MACTVTATAQNASKINPKDVEIIRDKWGVPHIYGKTDADAAYGLAWACAEDNFRDMQLSLLNGQSRLGEVLGKEGAILDFLMYFTGLDTLVPQVYEASFSPEFKKVLEAYAQGANAYAAAHPKEVLRKGLFPISTIDMVKGYSVPPVLMAGLGFSFDALMRDKLREYLNVNEDYLEKWIPSGSNAIAIDMNRTQSGEAYVLVNSHQPLEGRFAWWEVHTVSEEGLDVLGGQFPGGPCVFVGSNRNLTWAHTNNYHNFGDVYLLEINPDNKNQYKYDGKWVDFQERKVRVKAKVGFIRIPVKRKIQWSVHGPVYRKKQADENGKKVENVYAFRFPGAMDVRATEQWWRMGKANSTAEFKQVMEDYQALPLFNTVVADNQGEVFYVSEGMIPYRDPSLKWRWPLDGTDPRYLWDKLLPWDQKPMVDDPDCGYVFTANHTPLVATCPEENWDGDFPGLQRFMYNRGERFDKLFKELKGQKIAWEDFLNMKYEKCYDQNGSFMRVFDVYWNLDPAKYPAIADAITHLKAWNLCSEADNRHAALGMVTIHYTEKVMNESMALLCIRGASISEAQAVEALTEARKWLLKYHKALDVPMGNVLKHVREEDPIEAGLPIGGMREVNAPRHVKMGEGKHKGYFINGGGDCYYQLVRIPKGGVPQVQSINAFGASTHPDSPHYNDQKEMFVAEKTKEMPFDKAAIKANAERVYHPGE